MFSSTSIINKKERYYTSLVKALFWRSHGKLPKTTRETLARAFVDSLDFSDSKAMHKSMGGYADMILDNYHHRNAATYETLKRV